jgi:hypothetical protein
MQHPNRLLSVSLILTLGVLAQAALAQSSRSQTRAIDSTEKLVGRWRVTFTISSLKKNLVFDARAKGAGLFLLLDTGPDDTPAANPLAAAWSLLTNDRVSFSGEAELPIGTCCREIGTLLFKGRFSSANTISGKVIFVTSVDEEESPYQFRTVVGAFTATRVPK